MLPNPSLPAAVIFDMDGVLVDSNPFHLRKWAAFLRDHQIPFDEEGLAKVVLGHHNDYTFRHFFGDRLVADERHRLGEELEAKFRQVFAPDAYPFPGARRLIEECHTGGVVLAVASSAMAKNVNFIVDALCLRPYFQVVLSGSEILHPKPDPEIYLQTAARLGLVPAVCAALEDSFVGIKAAKGAGMKCLAVASTFPLNDLRRETEADLVAPSLEIVSLATLRGLFEGSAAPTPRP